MCLASDGVHLEWLTAEGKKSKVGKCLTMFLAPLRLDEDDFSTQPSWVAYPTRAAIKN